MHFLLGFDLVILLLLLLLLLLFSFQLDKLAALDLHPILLIGKNSENTVVADAILGDDHLLDDDLLQRLKTVYEAVLKSWVSCIFLHLIIL